MRAWLRLVAGCWLALGAASAYAWDCGRATNPAEQAVCRDAGLSKQDAELNKLYSGLRGQVTAKARAALLAQQRAWLAERNRTCASGDPGCLHKAYTARIDALEALNAAAQAADGKLDNVTPVMVKGSWKAKGIQDPAGAGHADEGALTKALSDAELPQVGGAVNAAPGKLCVGPKACDAMGWTRTTLGEVNASRAIERYLSLGATTPVLVGSSGATRSYYLLVPRGDGTLWAVFSLCGKGESDCRKAAEVWSPASGDAGFQPKE